MYTINQHGNNRIAKTVVTTNKQIIIKWKKNVRKICSWIFIIKSKLKKKIGKWNKRENILTFDLWKKTCCLWMENFRDSFSIFPIAEKKTSSYQWYFLNIIKWFVIVISWHFDPFNKVLKANQNNMAELNSVIIKRN